jgi:Viral BACON domain
VPRLFAPLLATVLMAACGDTNVSQVSGPDAVRCEISANPLSADVPFTAGEVRVAVRTDRDCPWTVSSNAAWLTSSPATGQGEATLTLAVAANTEPNPRVGVITIARFTVQVSQAPAPPPPPPPPPPCHYVLSPPTRVFGDRGGSGVVELATDAHCAWSVSTATPWITVTSTTSGTGAAVITYTLVQNFGRSSRTGSITIAGQSHIVVQSGVLEVR